MFIDDSKLQGERDLFWSNLVIGVLFSVLAIVIYFKMVLGSTLLISTVGVLIFLMVVVLAFLFFKSMLLARKRIRKLEGRFWLIKRRRRRAK